MIKQFIALLMFSSIAAQASCPLKDGDIVFIKSQSSQSKLLKISTESDWTHVGMSFKRGENWDIIEAVQPVKWTTLYSFLRRSHQLHFEVYRPVFEFDAKKIKDYAESKLGKDYDLIFAMDNQRWYCSELVWKAYQKGANEEIGSLEKVGDLKVDNPLVIAEAKRRFNGYGMPFSVEAWKASDVITPVQMMRSDRVIKVLDHQDVDSMKDCVLGKR